MPGLATPALHICTFALGCALIHGARAYTATVMRLLTGAAILLAVLVLLAASLASAPDIDRIPYDISIFDVA